MSISPKRQDHELLVLGEALTGVNQALGGETDEVERNCLTTRWFEIIETMAAVEATTSGGRRIKAGALIVYAARTGSVHKELALSLAGDLLVGGRS